MKINNKRRLVLRSKNKEKEGLVFVNDTIGLRGIRNGLGPCQTKAKLGLGIVCGTRVRANQRRRLH